MLRGLWDAAVGIPADTELLSEISEQLMQMKDIKARITARLTHVADANHYTEKYRALEQQRAMGKVRVPRTRAVFNVCGGSSCGSGGHIGVDEGPCTHTMRSTTTPPPP